MNLKVENAFIQIFRTYIDFLLVKSNVEVYLDPTLRKGYVVDKTSRLLIWMA